MKTLAEGADAGKLVIGGTFLLDQAKVQSETSTSSRLEAHNGDGAAAGNTSIYKKGTTRTIKMRRPEQHDGPDHMKGNKLDEI